MSVKKKSKSKKTGTSTTFHANDVIANSALKFVDQAAEILKKGIIFGSAKTAESRRAMHKKAVTIAGKATDRLNDAVNEGLRALNKKIKDL